MKISRKITLTIIILFIVSGGVYIGLRQQTAVSLNTTDTAAAGTDIADLMALIDMYPVSTPQSPPDFNLLSISGEKIQLGSYKGKVVLLGFWATW